ARMQHHHPGPDVGTRQPLAVELRPAGHDHAVRVAEDDPRAHVHELVDEEEPTFEHLLEDEHRPTRLGGNDDRDGRQVGREGGPRAVLDLRDLAPEVVSDLEVLAVRDMDGAPVDPHADTETLEGGQDRDQVGGLDVVDRDLAGGDRPEADEARHLDVVAADAVLAAGELGPALDVDDVRADAFDPRAEGDEESAQILDVRLARRVADHGLAAGENGGHDRVLRPGYARLVEEDVRRAQAVRPHPVLPVRLDLGAELRERVDVRVEPPPTDHVAAGRRDDRLSVAGEQRPGQQHGGPDPRAELLVELRLRQLGRVDTHLVRAGPVRVRAQVGDQLDHRLDVADPGDVPQHDRLRAEQAGGQDRPRAVRVPGRADRAVQRAGAL